MTTRRPALTLIETAVALGIVGLLGVLASGVSADLAEEARTAKCQSNLKQMITAIHAYAADYGGMLPGPVHPAIKRHLYDLDGTHNDRVKSLSWLLRPYYAPDGPADADPALPDAVVDGLMTCPTASLLVPDSAFFDLADTQTGCWRERPHNYVCNTWGPSASPGTRLYFSDTHWPQTDPPNYFGIWYYCDSSPARPNSCWQPKPLDAIPNPGAEWATGDAWSRRVNVAAQPRPGTPFQRPWLGTYPVQWTGTYLSILPAAPYHRVPPRVARSHQDAGVAILPVVPFEGETNLAYFDGHVAPVRAGWAQSGDGGTVNPFWQVYGGTHPLPYTWQAANCDGAR
ncbi:MAG TPA: DUF1559 domain-containing protein [Phycisphaerae bacterium]|nr:DUF1559 domain-containing protein [Phycisphaerae bacterium]